jgi:rhodanese-related sulfurtransferase
MPNFLSRLFSKSAEPGWLTTAELAASLTEAAQPLVIDVRGPGEFTGPLGHIDEARNIPLDTFAEHSESLAAEQRPIVLVCHTDRRSFAAAQHLRSNGMTEVAVLRGGMVAWRSEGR